MNSRDDIAEDRRAEYDALFGLLMEDATEGDTEAATIADWISRSALKPGHLYRGMGLEDRSEIRRLLETHFPALAAGNDRDMRWKKYLYKRLCGWPGFEG